tara:strand:- start:605 stop:1048 length:444 start_codon:yes stop_codon:yes gene_type:complete
MSKDLFLMMRESEIKTSNFLPTKKEIQLSSKNFVKDIFEAGNVNQYELIAQAKRLSEALDVITSEILENLPQENFEAFGLKGIFRNGGDTINYKDDQIWLEIQKTLKQREELIKTALKSDLDIYDEIGVQVSKVSTTPRKSALSISF